MAKTKDKEIEKVAGTQQGSSALARLAHEDKSLSGMEKYVFISRLKLIQGTTEGALKDRFGEGSLIIRPGDGLVARKNDIVRMIPIHFHTEYCKWADRRDKESKMIVERSYSPMSEIAKRAQDANKRFELYPDQEKKKEKDQWKYRYVEHLNFVFTIFGEHDFKGQEVAFSFSRGEFTQGRKYISALKLRRSEVDGQRIQTPLWAQVWDFMPKYREVQENKWYGLDFAPADNPTLPEEFCEAFYARHVELSRAHEERRLQLGEDEGDSVEDPSAAEM
jgi:hypothetical protein